MSTAGSERLKRYAIRIAACLIGAMLIALLVVVVRGEALISGAAGLIEGSIDILSDRVRSGTFVSWITEGNAEWLRYETRQVAFGFLFGAVSLALIAFHTLKRPYKPWLKHVASTGLVFIIAFDLALTARSYYASHPRGNLFETEGIGILKSALGPPGEWRTLSYGRRKRVFTPNTNQIFGIYSVQGRATIIPDTFPRLLRESRREDSPGRKEPKSYKRSVGSIADLMSARFLLIPRLEPAWLPSPVVRAIASEEHLAANLKILAVDGDSRLAFTQAVGDSLTLDVYLPEAASLDLAVAVTPGVPAPCDSVLILIRCECEAGIRDLVTHFDPRRDAGRWHPFSLDMSWAQAGPGKVTLVSRALRERDAHDVVVGWGDLEFVTGSCRQAEIHGGCEVALDSPASAVSFEIESDAREVPLEISRGNSPPVRRWIGFLPGSSSRHVTLDIAGRTRRLAITSDSTFSLTGLKSVNTGPRWSSGYSLFYDGDMLVLENFSAYKKGICVGEGGASLEERDGRQQLCVCPVDELYRFKNGECRVVSYEPERVELETSTARDGYLILQETFYPGWRARVDGVSSRIFETNMGIRAVELTPGEHTVVMEFAPRSFRLGLVLTLLGVVLATVWAALPRRGST
jgi:hypothetical protein